MIGYTTLGTNDFARACSFYDSLLAEVGGSRMMEEGDFVAWASPGEGGALCVIRPHDGKAATVGNGVMAAIAAESAEQVDRVYARAMSLGATDEGPPGPRGEGFYAGYFRDPDGNKLNVYFMG
jgi:catechol 2,3-dioxygenase-like lactoylglutathione lyase family enzyme